MTLQTRQQFFECYDFQSILYLLKESIQMFQYLCLPESLDTAQDCLVLDLKQLVEPNVDWKYHQIIGEKQHGKSNYRHQEHLLFLDYVG